MTANTKAYCLKKEDKMCVTIVLHLTNVIMQVTKYKRCKIFPGSVASLVCNAHAEQISAAVRSNAPPRVCFTWLHWAAPPSGPKVRL